MEMRPNPSLFFILSVLFAAVLLTLFVEYADERWQERLSQERVEKHLNALSRNLQQLLDRTSEESRVLAGRLAKNPAALENPKQAGVLEAIHTDKPIILKTSVDRLFGLSRL